MKCGCGGIIVLDVSVDDVSRTYCCICGRSNWETFTIRRPSKSEKEEMHYQTPWRKKT